MAVAAFTLLVAHAGWTATEDPCAGASSVPDIRFVLALKDGRTRFQAGEIIPLVLSFTSSTKGRYWADVREYDRKGRLDIESYCVEPNAPDPLASYFKTGAFLSGGLGGTWELGATPLLAEAELNDWRSLGPGRYRVYAISNDRIWRPPDAREQTPYGRRVQEVVRSNTVEIEVMPPDAQWQAEQLRAAMQVLAATPPPEEAHRAARRLRFLNSQESTRQLARRFSELDPQQPATWEFMFGLYGSPYRALAIDSMHEQIAVPGHAIGDAFVRTLVNLQVNADPAWDPPSKNLTDSEAAEFYNRWQARTLAVTKAEMEKVAAAIPRKTGSARAVTLHGLLVAGGLDQPVARTIRPALIAAWTDLPIKMQQDLIQYRWPLIAGPEMLSVLRRIVAEPPPAARTDAASTRDAALRHILEMDPSTGRQLILRDALDPNAHPGIEVVELLPKEDLAIVARPAVDRIGRNVAREVDYELLDRYADASALGVTKAVFEAHSGRWTCWPPSTILRYLVRVDPAYGAKQVSASLKAGRGKHCFCDLLRKLGDQLPGAQQIAIDALDDSDPNLVQDAVAALGRWGSAEAEEALWKRLRRYHQEWAGLEDQLQTRPGAKADLEGRGANGATLEQALFSAIAQGSNWICPPVKLASLAGLVFAGYERRQIETWIGDWKQTPVRIDPRTSGEGHWTFSVLQYERLTEDQMRAKLGQFPRGTRLLWHFWQPGEISPPVSMALQDEIYDHMRRVAEKNGVELGKLNHP